VIEVYTMKVWGAICLISLGGFTESGMSGWHDAPLWGLFVGVSLLGWCWSAIFAGTCRLWAAITGKRAPLAQTDPRALAAEIAALNAQLAQLRDTGTAFDMSFDKTLECMDERLRQVEQRTRYTPAPQSVPVGRQL
jgi:hypothetical protein